MGGTNRKVKYGINSAVFTIAVIAIAVMAYYLAVKHPAKYDMTAAKLNTLSPETRDMLKRLDKPVRAIVFIPDDRGYAEPRKKIDDLMQQMSRLSRMFSFQVVDPTKSPVATEKAQMADPGIYFECGERKKKIYMEDLFSAPDQNTGEGGEFKGEQAIFNSVSTVAMGKTYMVCFTQGHGERRMTDQRSPDGAGLAVKLLEDQGYALQPVNIAAQKGVADNCNIVIAAGPEKGFSGFEAAEVEKFLSRGGGLMALIDPFMDSGLEPVLLKYGITVKNGVVNDPRSSFGKNPFELMAQYRPGPITEKLLEKNLTINLLLTRPLVAAGAAAPLLETSADAWSDTTGTGKPDGGADVMAIGATSERGAGKVKARVVAVGDSDFMTNKSLAAFVSTDQGTTVIQQGGTGNADFFLNAATWLSGDEKAITIRPKPLDLRPLNIDGMKHKRVFMLFTFGVPFVILAAGWFVWRWRRSL